MKKLLALALAAAMMFSLVACGGGSNAKADEDPLKIVILGQSSSEANMLILQDQLTKAGFNVELNTQPDYASMTAAQQAGNYDLALSGWTTVTGNLDYAVRGIFHSTGDYNRSPIVDEKVDELIDKASTETAEVAKGTYKELEDYLVGEMAYVLPMYYSNKIQAYHNDVLKDGSVYWPKSRPGRWEMYDYVNAADRDTRELNLTQASSSPTTLDPIQANDGTMNTLSGNMYIKIINLSDDDEIMTDSSLSRAYAIAEGNEEYYFLLRDDVFFAKAEDGHAVDTGVRVGGEDVLFSLNRAKDINSVPNHATYTLHNHMQTVEMVTDIDELKAAIDSDTGKSVFDVLSEGATGPITTLTDDKTAVNNASGTYQVIKVTTTVPFPQVLNYLAHQSAGILCAEQVESLNSKFDVANYDPQTDVGYGDFAAIKGGDNHLWCSGPYQFVTVDDYGITFEKNPGYMAGDAAFAPKINKIYMRFIADASAQISAFRAGELDLVGISDFTQVDNVKADNVTVMERSSNGVTYCYLNLGPNSKLLNQDLRLAILYAIDQNDFVTYNNGHVNPAFSTVSTFFDTGNVLVQDLEKSAEYRDAYLASLEG